jgi:hypothetical protein
MANWSSAASGAVSGGAAGSAAGPWGAVAGGIVGGVTGLFSKKKKKNKKKSTLDPQQQKLYNDTNDAVYNKGPLADLYNYDAEAANRNFDLNEAAPANRNFKENTVPTITGNFRGKGLQNSSYVGEALARSGRDLNENLNAKRSAMQFAGQENAKTNKRNAIENNMNRNTQAYDKAPQEPSTIDQILNSIGPTAGEWLKDYMNKKGPNTALNGASGSQSRAAVGSPQVFNRSVGVM